MNKAFYIVGIVFSVIFLMVGAYYAEEVSAAKWNSYFAASYSNYGDLGYNYSYDYSVDDDLTVSAGLWSLFFIACFVAIDLMGLLKVKTKTVKILSIIGLSLSGIFLLWSLAVVASPGSISFDEVYPAWALYCLTMLAFTIVGLIQSVRYAKLQSKPLVTNNQSSTKDLLDS